MSSPRMTAAARMQRLLAILQWAAAYPEGVPVDELCERFKLAPEEVAHELELASMIGADSPHYDDMPFEVFFEDGLVFVRLFSFRRPMRLTPVEGLALVAAADVLVERAGPDAAAGPLERALAKLAALVGVEPGEVIDVDLDPGGGETGMILTTAIAQDRQVEFTYWTYGRDCVERRIVDPWVTYSADGAWYLVGWAHDPGAARTFRLDRMEDVAASGGERSQAMPTDLVVGEPRHDGAPKVVLDLAPGSRWVAEAYPVLEARQLDNHRLRVTLGVSGASWLERLLLQLGPDASVVEIDPSLGSTDLAAQAARRVLSRYGGGSD